MSNPYGVDPNQMLTPLPYEDVNGFSQHGETGIINTLIENLSTSNKFFLEIGWGNGLGNMTIDLIIKDWAGVGVDMFDKPHPDAKLNDKFRYVSMKVTPFNLDQCLAGVPKDFDFFSLDIDSYDFEVARELLKKGYRPKISCVEFNPRFGPTIEASFPFKEIPKKKLYRKHGIYGSSIAKYRKLWEHYGYKFFTYDTSLTNLFFYRPDCMKDLTNIPVHSIESFPIKQDKNKQIIIDHGMWVSELTEIYKDFKL